MLKRIVIFFKRMVITKRQSPDLFTRRFDAGDSLADQHQWNGGRHLSTKELQCLNKEPNKKLAAQHVL